MSWCGGGLISETPGVAWRSRAISADVQEVVYPTFGLFVDLIPDAELAFPETDADPRNTADKKE